MKKKIRNLLFVLGMALVLGVSVPATVYADTVIKINVASDDSEWEAEIKGITYNEGVPGHGVIIKQESSRLTKYTGSSTEIILPTQISYSYVQNGAISIPDKILDASAFSGTNVTTVSGCTGWTFKNGAFNGSKVSTLDSNTGKMTFAAGAFLGDTAKKITLTGNSVLKTGCFSGCKNVETIVLSGDVTLEAGAFSGCTNLQNIVFKKGTTIIDNGTFRAKTLGCSDSVVLQTYGADGLWKMRDDSAYKVERMDAYISCNDSTTKLYAGDKLDLNAELINDSAVSVQYLSSDTKVVKVSSKGKITALKSGKATVTILVTSAKKVYTKKLNLSVYNILNKSVVLKKGKTYAVKPTVTIKDVKFTYTTSDKKVCSVSSKGRITAKKTGTAVIKIKSSRGGVGKIKVKVVKK